MSTTAAQALDLARNLAAVIAASNIDGEGLEIAGRRYTADELQSEFERGLASLRQGPMIVDDLGVQSLIRAEIAKLGSAAELARRMGITRQSLHAVYNADAAPGPAVLGYFGLRRITGRARYERLD